MLPKSQDEQIMKLVTDEVNRLEESGRFLNTKEYLQHGSVSVYNHCINVAYLSGVIAKKYKLKVDWNSMIRGALLHDYFLYDWHEKHQGHRFHGLFHAKKALKNAREDFDLTQREENIILRHMFPLNPIPPVCLEAWVVCMADKISASRETVEERNVPKNQNNSFGV